MKMDRYNLPGAGAHRLLSEFQHCLGTDTLSHVSIYISV